MTDPTALSEAELSRVQDILHFWFDDPNQPDSEYGQQRKIWFKKNPDFDQQIRDRFLADYNRAAQGDLDHWHHQPQACLALILLLDQFPRNLFRGQPQAFATDDQALELAQCAIAHHYDQQLQPVERIFLYLPLEHSENMDHQEQAVQLFQQLHASHPEFENSLDYALRHRDVIARFGRFPHRNQILGRETTPEEAEFLQQPGSSF
jgi:uncharacterized protein (DUF924 family)